MGEARASVPAQAEGRRHVAALDGVRGLAIALVLVYHLLAANDATTSVVMRWLFAVRDSCWVGVDLFYVLSGFLITGILVDSLGDRGYFRKFYVRRTLRIFPLYYGVLLGLVALTRPLHLHWHGGQWVLLLYLQNTGLGVPLFSIVPSYALDLTSYWSLAVEEHFYLVWPFLVFWIRDVRRLLMTALALSAGALLLRGGLLLHGVDPRFLYCFTACRADALLLGGALALLMRGPWRARTLRLAPWVFGASLLVVGVQAARQNGLNWDRGWFTPTFGFTATALGSAGLIAMTMAGSGWTRRVFEMGWLRFLGRYSYGIYVLHALVGGVVFGYTRMWLRAGTGSKLWSVVGAGVLAAAVSIAVAWLSYHLYEERFLRLKERFQYSRRTRQEQAEALARTSAWSGT